MTKSFRVPARDLTRFVGALLVAAGLPKADAALFAGAVVLQEMRGVRTHGLRFLPDAFTELRDGVVNPRPRRKRLRDAGATAVLDGDNGVGALGCMEAMDLAIDKAREHGLGIAVVVNNNHFISAAPYCLRAAERNMIGLIFSNTWAGMGYPGAAGRVTGNGPMGFAAPTAAGYAMVFDSALTTSYGKLNQWIREGRSIPAAFQALDALGRPTSDPRKVVAGGTPLPIGNHKGAGLVLMIEVLTGVLGGGAFLSGILPPTKRRSKRDAESQCCIAIDIKRFMPVRTFRARMKALIDDLKSRPRAQGCEEILAPGERAGRKIRECAAKGVVIEPDVAADLLREAEALGVTPPPQFQGATRKRR